MSRISVPMIDQIRKLYLAGYSIRGIARSLNISRNTVKNHIRCKASEEPKKPQHWSDDVDWEFLAKKRKSGVSVKQLYADYGPSHVGYGTFGDWLRKKSKQAKLPTVHLVHNPGEKTQIDYCDGIYLVDRKTGNRIKTYLFCGVLPFSSYTFAEFVMDQKLPSFIKSHQNMWAFFGGVTPYVVIDNLKSGVKKAHVYDPDVNQTYCDYGNNDGFAVLPARPYKPRDKASVEAAVGAIQRSFFQEVREKIFYSLAELNSEFRRFLSSFNNLIMKDYGVSRSERFGEEKKHLLPLPEKSYEIKTWKSSKVHPDSTIQVAKNQYSVPYKFIGQTVKVRLGDSTIEVFNEQMVSIACHYRVKGKIGQKVIEAAHYPGEKEQLARFDVKKAKSQAKAIGPKMSQLIHLMFDGPRPLENLRRVQGMLRVWKKEGIKNVDMEYAASQCLTFERYRVKYFEECAKHHKDTGQKPIRSLPMRDNDEVFLHSTTRKE